MSGESDQNMWIASGPHKHHHMGTERISRDEMLMNIAEIYSMRSTCSRAQVGVVVARQGRVLVGSYNGAPSRMTHCDHSCDCPANLEDVGDGLGPHQSDCASQKPCVISVHAEANAVAWASRMGTRLDGAELFTTMAPCRACAMLIVNAGLRRVVCKNPYRDDSGVQLLQVAGVRVSLP